MKPFTYLAAAMVGGGIFAAAVGLALRFQAGVPLALGPTGEPVATILERVIDRATAPFLGRGGAARTSISLAQADIRLRPQEWYALRAMTPGGAFLIDYFLQARLATALAVAVIAYAVPGIVLRLRRRGRRLALVRQLPESLVLMTNALEGGLALLQAVQAAAETMPSPIGEEFGRVVREVELGISLDAAFDHMAHRLNNQDFAMAVAAIQINRQLGGSLAEVLRSVTTTIRERVKLQDRLAVLTTQSRTSAYIITALPVVVALILLLIVPRYMAPLFTNALGYLTLALALAMLGLAYFLMNRFTRVEG